MSHRQSPPEPFSFADALGEELDEITPLDDKTTVDLKSQRRDTDLLAKQLKRASITQRQENDANPLSLSLRSAVKPDDMLSYKKPGIQEGVFKNLRLAKYPLEGVIDLQRIPLEEARRVLFQKTSDLHQQGVRVVLVKHGRGELSKPIPALLKSYVYQWCQELEWVIALHSAQRQHGSFSASYVLLKKHSDQKQMNRERLFKRGK
ncbi:DNA endonuclease SmrA [Alteromonas oceanisediminis]|uniref:DNA endonuclease SmrA n=1 Tax=Alteromonas oceanisediminis TaxID=2836180 RepID=UPI001BD97CED|nr:DNA endonuclease SmrA [Alteromonas oceanisediminis]MBT0584989.1 DNA endonuclease SmrA [Alteromonas oceanisediminis]